MPPILSVVGARPQFIKAAPVSRALARAGLTEYLVHTGQHYDREMSGSFFEELGIREPDVNLQIGGGTHGEQTGRMLPRLEAVMQEQRPGCVLVYGDTNSTLAGALAASKLRIPIAHVEAGLRSFNRGMPEEINRIVTDVLSSILFTPTDTGCRNLIAEGIAPEKIVLAGDVMYDSMLLFREKARATSRILERLNLTPGAPYVLATVHRAENTDDPARLDCILRALTAVARKMRVILPLHPRTRGRLGEAVSNFAGIDFVEPLGFLDMVQLEMRAAVIATDSGGVQKEAFFHRVPCVTLRDETEWVELVDTGWNRLAAPSDPKLITDTILGAQGKTGKDTNPYGSGPAPAKIAASLCSFLTK